MADQISSVEHHELKAFLHCFLEREVFLFTVAHLSSSISSFETAESLETSAASSCWLGVVVLALVPVDSRPCGTAAIFGEKSATIRLKLRSKVGKPCASNCSAAWRSLSSFKNCKQLNSSISIWKRGNLGNRNCKICPQNDFYFLQSDWLVQLSHEM